MKMMISLINPHLIYTIIHTRMPFGAVLRLDRVLMSVVNVMTSVLGYTGTLGGKTFIIKCKIDNKTKCVKKNKKKKELARS